MIIIKEAYLRDILVLKFPPSGRLVCHSFSSAGEFVFGCISPWMFQSGWRGWGGADKVNSPLHTSTYYFITETKPARKERVASFRSLSSVNLSILHSYSTSEITARCGRVLVIWVSNPATPLNPLGNLEPILGPSKGLCHFRGKVSWGSFTRIWLQVQSPVNHSWVLHRPQRGRGRFTACCCEEGRCDLWPTSAQPGSPQHLALLYRLGKGEVCPAQTRWLCAWRKLFFFPFNLHAET